MSQMDEITFVYLEGKRVRICHRQLQFLQIVKESFLNSFDCQGELLDEKYEETLDQILPLLQEVLGKISRCHVKRDFVENKRCKKAIADYKTITIDSHQQVSPINSEREQSSPSASPLAAVNSNPLALQSINREVINAFREIDDPSIRMQIYLNIVKNNFLNYYDVDGELKVEKIEDFLNNMHPIMNNVWSDLKRSDLIVAYIENQTCKNTIKAMKQHSIESQISPIPFDREPVISTSSVENLEAVNEVIAVDPNLSISIDFGTSWSINDIYDQNDDTIIGTLISTD